MDSKKFQDKINAALASFPYEEKFYVKDLIKDPPVGINVWLKKNNSEVVSLGIDETGEEQFKKVAHKK